MRDAEGSHKGNISSTAEIDSEVQVHCNGQRLATQVETKNDITAPQTIAHLSGYYCVAAAERWIKTHRNNSSLS